MKKAVLFFTVLFVSSFVYCQKIKEETVSLLKDKRPCLVAEYDIPSEVLENVVEDYLSKEGLKKPSSKSGFKLYEKAIYAKISNDAMDYYIKVDGNKEKSKVIVVISKGYENFITISEGGIYSNFKDVLKNFQEVPALIDRAQLHDSLFLVILLQSNLRRHLYLIPLHLVIQHRWP